MQVAALHEDTSVPTQTAEPGDTSNFQDEDFGGKWSSYHLIDRSI